VQQSALLFPFVLWKHVGSLHDTVVAWMQTIAERPSTKVIQYLLNEATRFGLIMLCKLNQ
jgi:hypothetical protein